jgi:hypothetical protein
MHEFYPNLPQPAYARSGSRMVFDVRTRDAKVAVEADALKRGLDAAMHVLAREGVSPYVAYCANYLLARDLHDAQENPDVTEETLAYFVAMGPWGNAWGEAEFIALDLALRDLPCGQYEYRCLVDWDDRKPSEKDEYWHWHSKRDGETYKPFWFVSHHHPETSSAQ